MSEARPALAEPLGEQVQWVTALNLWIKRFGEATTYIREQQAVIDQLTIKLKAALEMLTEEQLKELHERFSA